MHIKWSDGYKSYYVMKSFYVLTFEYVSESLFWGVRGFNNLVSPQFNILNIDFHCGICDVDILHWAFFGNEAVLVLALVVLITVWQRVLTYDSSWNRYSLSCNLLLIEGKKSDFILVMQVFFLFYGASSVSILGLVVFMPIVLPSRYVAI